MKKEAILVFQKNPIKGRVKSRLAATIGEDAALEIYQFLVDQTFRAVRGTAHEVLVFYSDFIPETSPNSPHFLKIQKGSDLGEKMKNAFDEAFSMGFQKAVIIGTDCPELTSDLLSQAFENLNCYDLVIGPAEDGGYYLLGMKVCHPYLFENIEWSTSKVFSRTLEQANLHHLNTSLLPTLHDIDEEKDWQRFVSRHPENTKLGS
jgi:rSAM/selenodomain-associated transferase 1